MRHSLFCAAAALGLFATHAPEASANGGSQLTLEPVRDNTIWDDPAGAISNGSGDFVIAGNNGQSKARRALLAFDVAGSVPAGATITSASLTLTLNQTSSGPHSVGLHRATSDWGEGASVAGGGSGAVAEPGDATWLHTFYDTNFWATAGGDFVALTSASTTVDQLGEYTWSSAQLVADVQAMLDDPSGDHGWFVLSDETQPQTTKRFSSREAAVASERPRLAIDYVEAPVSYCTAGTSLSGCVSTLSASGIPSASAASGFTLDSGGIEGGGAGLYVWGIGGRRADPYRGSSSYLCVRPPSRRTAPTSGGGTAGLCDGFIGVDLNAAWAAGRRPKAGTTVQVQLWYQDQAGGALSDALELVVCP